ncbi:MAG: hypothetical protein KA149_01705 [Chitinophagales bacterium]|nr:hypothetical protein [Chitinophagales bacterium]
MKNNIRTIAAAIILNLVAFNAWSQNEVAVLNNGNETVVTEKPVVPAAVNKEVQIVLKNAAEKSVAVFAGPKEEIKDPKLKVVGGLSKNTLYLKENDAVCLMTVDKRPLACTMIKPGITSVEVNVSANGISSK